MTVRFLGKCAHHHNQYARCHSQPTTGYGSKEFSQSLNSYIIATGAFYLCATLVALAAAQPREYSRYDYNLSKMRRVLAEIRRYKSRRVRLAAAFFALGSLSLALLIGAIVLAA